MIATRSRTLLRLPRSVGNLSKDVFERRTSTGSEAFFLFIYLDAIKFSLLTFFSLLKTIYPRVLTKPLPNDAKSPLPVDARRSKTLLLKLPSSGPDKTAMPRRLVFAYTSQTQPELLRMRPVERSSCTFFINPVVSLAKVN